jgi:hypothetical protein
MQLAKENGVFSPFSGFGLAKIPEKRAKTYPNPAKRAKKTCSLFSILSGSLIEQSLLTAAWRSNLFSKTIKPKSGCVPLFDSMDSFTETKVCHKKFKVRPF